MLATIPIDLIENGQRLRDISEATVEALVNSIADVGLLNPITVYRRKLYQGGNQVDGYGLVAGLHRKTAYERLGLTEIEANIVDLSDLECQIAECDENLVANQLSASERARFTKRRKDAYEALHGKAKAKGAHAANEAMGRDHDANANFADAFTTDTAKATGQAERTVQLNAERGEKVDGKALDMLHGTKLDTGTYLDKLKKLTPNDQVDTAKRDLADLRRREREGSRPRPVSVRKVTLDADIKQRAAKACAEMLAEYLPADAWDHFKSNLAVTTTKDLLTEFTNITGNSIIDRSAA